ncbi:MAG: hypothetical protein K1000chlam2_00200 [Chlamydiae bacterium]|nr:hypothetical protein [Chlamydiota bacterium]
MDLCKIKNCHFTDDAMLKKLSKKELTDAEKKYQDAVFSEKALAVTLAVGTVLAVCGMLYGTHLFTQHVFPMDRVINPIDLFTANFAFRTMSCLATMKVSTKIMDAGIFKTSNHWLHAQIYELQLKRILVHIKNIELN